MNTSKAKQIWRSASSSAQKHLYSRNKEFRAEFIKPTFLSHDTSPITVDYFMLQFGNISYKQ
jgi:hypothetical protein